MRKLGPIQYRRDDNGWHYPVFICAACRSELDKCDGVIIFDTSLKDPPIYAACRGVCHDIIHSKVGVSKPTASPGWVRLEDFIGYITSNSGYKVAGKWAKTGSCDIVQIKRRKSLSST